MSRSDDLSAEFVATVPDWLRWRFTIDETTGCFRAIYGPRSGNHGNYPAVNIAGRALLLHRLIWQQANGPIPDGKQIARSACWIDDCCRLAHMAALSWSDLHHAWRAHHGHKPATATKLP